MGQGYQAGTRRRSQNQLPDLTKIVSRILCTKLLPITTNEMVRLVLARRQQARWEESHATDPPLQPPVVLASFLSEVSNLSTRSSTVWKVFGCKFCCYVMTVLKKIIFFFFTCRASSSWFPRTCSRSCWQWYCHMFAHCCYCCCFDCSHSSCSRCCLHWRCWRQAGGRERWRRGSRELSWLCFLLSAWRKW